MKHPLGADKAKLVLDHAFKSYAERFAKFQPQLAWQSATQANISFSAKGVSIQGTAELNPGSIDIELEVPFILRVFKKQAIEKLEEEAQRWVQKAQAGEI